MILDHINMRNKIGSDNNTKKKNKNLTSKNHHTFADHGLWRLLASQLKNKV